MSTVSHSFLPVENQNISCLALNPVLVLGSQALNTFYPCWRWYRRLRFIQDRPDKISSFFAIGLSSQVVSMTALRSKKVGPFAQSLSDAIHKLAHSTDLVRCVLEAVEQQYAFSRTLGTWVRVVKRKPYVRHSLYPQLSQKKWPVGMRQLVIKVNQVAVATVYLLGEILKLVGSYVELYEWRKRGEEWLNHSAWDLYQNIEIINEFYQKKKDVLLETVETNGPAIERLCSLFYLPMKVTEIRFAIQSSGILMSSAQKVLHATNFFAIGSIEVVGNLSGHGIKTYCKKLWHKVNVLEGKSWQLRHPFTFKEKLDPEAVADQVGEMLEKVAEEIIKEKNKEQGIDDFFEKLKR